MVVCPSSMALIEIVCPRCGRHGYVPGTPGCPACWSARNASLLASCAKGSKQSDHALRLRSMPMVCRISRRKRANRRASEYSCLGCRQRLRYGRLCSWTGVFMEAVQRVAAACWCPRATTMSQRRVAGSPCYSQAQVRQGLEGVGGEHRAQQQNRQPREHCCVPEPRRPPFAHDLIRSDRPIDA